MQRRHALLSMFALSAAGCHKDEQATPRSAAPPVTLTPSGAPVMDSAQALSHGPLVVAFHRYYWCRFCPTPLGQLQRQLGEFRAAGATVWGLTHDANEDVPATISGLSLGFPFATDPSGHLAQALSVADQDVICVLAPNGAGGEVVFRMPLVIGRERETVAAALEAVRSLAART